MIDDQLSKRLNATRDQDEDISFSCVCSFLGHRLLHAHGVWVQLQSGNSISSSVSLTQVTDRAQVTDYTDDASRLRRRAQHVSLLRHQPLGDTGAANTREISAGDSSEQKLSHLCPCGALVVAASIRAVPAGVKLFQGSGIHGIGRACEEEMLT